MQIEWLDPERMEMAACKFAKIKENAQYKNRNKPDKYMTYCSKFPDKKRIQPD